MTSVMYDYEITKRYNAKCKQYTIKYTLKELNVPESIEKALSDTNLTANAWIKQAIAEKLERDGYIVNAIKE